VPDPAKTTPQSALLQAVASFADFNLLKIGIDSAAQ
jgi:hypothetical protein